MSERIPLDLSELPENERGTFIWVRDRMQVNLLQATTWDDDSLYAIQAVRDGLNYLLKPAQTVEVIHKREPFKGLVKRPDAPEAEGGERR